MVKGISDQNGKDGSGRIKLKAKKQELKAFLRHQFAGFAAGLAIVKTVLAEAHIKSTLAESTVPFAGALLLGLLTDIALKTRFAGHGETLALESAGTKCRW